jgi:type II restriction/modification system DNA methylase subunit YeeA
MNKSVLKSYAPQARRDFIQAVTDRAGVLGLSAQKIEPVEVRGDVAMIAGRPFPKDVASHRRELEIRIKRKGFSQVMEEVAYTWFNRFTALRYMELHDYLGHGCRVLSNPSGSDIPEILEKATSVDLPGLDTDKVAELRLAGDRDAELYRLLLVTQCNQLHRVMPMLFEKVHDATELLLPENLLQTNSPIRKLVNAVPEENWNEIEIVGWLYQFYISEKKDQVIGKVVQSEDIPAATQLFTPNWIVKYMVQNTLGRKWLMTYPASSIKAKMEFYIEPAEQEPEVQAKLEAITPKELNPEELTFMDPACGSGHILAEAYDLFKEIYLERGYRTRDIPRLILEKNLYGLDIDDRAAQLARFTVLMKARADDRRILDPDNPARLNIMAIQESKGLDVDEAARVLLRERVKEINSKGQQQLSLIQPNMTKGTLSTVEKPDVTREELYSLLHLFQDGKTFGSLLTVHDRLKEALPRLEKLVAKALTASDMESRRWAEALVPLVKQTKLIASQYGCVVTNPPYMGGKGLNVALKTFLKDNYADVKSDLFSAFVVRNFEMSKDHAQLGFMSPFVWMFISSYEKLRDYLIDEKAITSLIQLEYSGFDGATVPICTYTLANTHLPNLKGSYIRLSDFRGADNQAPKTLEAIQNKDCGWYYTASASDFKKIPGCPIAYWIRLAGFEIYEKSVSLGSKYKAMTGMRTGDNERFLRHWPEVSWGSIGLNYTKEKALGSGKKWFPYNKGGGFNKWYGNNELLVNWEDDGKEIKDLTRKNYPQLGDNLGWKITNEPMYFQPGITWGGLTSAVVSFRWSDSGALFDSNKGAMLFPNEADRFLILGFLNSSVVNFLLNAINPTLSTQNSDINSLPIITDELGNIESKATETVKSILSISKKQDHSIETSWDFEGFALLNIGEEMQDVESSYKSVRSSWIETTLIMQSLEEENNRIFARAYGLQGTLSTEAPLDTISLPCNPYYRYGSGKAEEEYEILLRADTIKELISYAIGCMMGRYSLDEPGLIYAHSGNEGFDPSRYATFPADEDGIVPVMDDDWFEDDATNRFVEFLKVAWSPETLDENLKFVADSLEPKRGEAPIGTIRRFISQKFFKDHHLRVYKKRPIYWLFSSGRHKAFECLVYLHRYNENTLARMRAMYVTPLQGKLGARIEYLETELPAAGSTSATKKLQKELDTMRKKQQELREFDEHLRHYADQRISLDLDDGVKVNYGKFGKLLAEVKAVTGGSPE